jgi:hypothetical protein
MIYVLVAICSLVLFGLFVRSFLKLLFIGIVAAPIALFALHEWAQQRHPTTPTIMIAPTPTPDWPVASTTDSEYQELIKHSKDPDPTPTPTLVRRAELVRTPKR